MPNLEESVMFEQRFWLQIMGDHGRFIYNSLSPMESKEIIRAQEFINIFDSLLEQVRLSLKGEALMAMINQSYQYTQELRSFKLHLLKRHLAGQVKIHLPPTFLNHMLNELEEYMRVLCSFKSGQIPEFHPVHYHLLWLTDAEGHAASVANNLDDVEKDFIKKSKEFKKDFEGLHGKAEEIAGYLRTNLNKFPALSRFNKDVELKMLSFMCFLLEVKDLRINKQLLGTLMPIMADHMYREECYYLTKLSQVSDVNKPDCDPGKPRLEE